MNIRTAAVVALILVASLATLTPASATVEATGSVLPADTTRGTQVALSYTKCAGPGDGAHVGTVTPKIMEPPSPTALATLTTAAYSFTAITTQQCKTLTWTWTVTLPQPAPQLFQNRYLEVHFDDTASQGPERDLRMPLSILPDMTWTKTATPASPQPPGTAIQLRSQLLLAANAPSHSGTVRATVSRSGQPDLDLGAQPYALTTSTTAQTAIINWPWTPTVAATYTVGFTLVEAGTTFAGTGFTYQITTAPPPPTVAATLVAQPPSPQLWCAPPAILTWTKTVSGGSSQQTGSVYLRAQQGVDVWPNSPTQAYNFATGSQVKTFTFEPPAPGTWTLTVEDTVTQGVERDRSLEYVVQPLELAWNARYPTGPDGLPTCHPFGSFPTGPGLRNQSGDSWLTYENTNATSRFVNIQFLDRVFRNDDGLEIPIDGNIRFFYGFSPNEAPGTVTFDDIDGDIAMLPPSLDGTATIQVPAGERLWVNYRVLEQSQDVQPGDYSAPFTVNAYKEI